MRPFIRRGPVCEFADWVHYSPARSEALVSNLVLPIPSLIDGCAIPSFDRSYVLDDLLPLRYAATTGVS